MPHSLPMAPVRSGMDPVSYMTVPKKLGDGLKKLDDGSDTLQSSLADGAETVKENKSRRCKL